MFRKHSPRATAALAVVAISLFLLLTLPAYGPAEFADPALLASSGTAARVAAWFVDLCGAGAYVFAVLPLTWGVVVYFRERTPDLVLRAVGTVLLAGSTASIVGMLHGGERSFWAGDVGTSAAGWFAGLGGWLGDGAAMVLGWTLVAVFFVVSLMLATDWMFHSIRRPLRTPVMAPNDLATEPPSADLLQKGETPGPREFVVDAPALIHSDSEHEPVEEFQDEVPEAHEAEEPDLGSLEDEGEILEPEAPEAPAAVPVSTVPAGWSADHSGERTLLRAPVGYQGVEFLPPSDELADPTRYDTSLPNVQDEHRVTSEESDMPAEEVVLYLLDEVFGVALDDEETDDAEPQEWDSQGIEEPRAEAADLATPEADDHPEAFGGIGLPDGAVFLHDEMVSFDVVFAGGQEVVADAAPVPAAAEPEMTPPASVPEPAATVHEAPVAETFAEPSAASRETPTDEVFVDDMVLGSLHDVAFTEEYVVAVQRTPAEPAAPVVPAPAVTGIGRPEGAETMDDDAGLPLFRGTESPSVHGRLPTGIDPNRLETMDLDPLFRDAVSTVLARGRASAVLLQREFGIGYSRGSRILDQMAQAGLVGPDTPTGSRDVLVTQEAWAELRQDG